MTRPETDDPEPAEVSSSSIPAEVEADSLEVASQADAPPPAIDGLFYRGTLIRLARGMETGLVRTASGRDISFQFQFVEFVGGAACLAELREGMSVGYDVGWTSRGLRVTKIARSLDEGSAELGEAGWRHGSERKPGAEQQEAAEELTHQDRQGRDVE